MACRRQTLTGCAKCSSMDCGSGTMDCYLHDNLLRLTLVVC